MKVGNFIYYNNKELLAIRFIFLGGILIKNVLHLP